MELEQRKITEWRQQTITGDLAEACVNGWYVTGKLLNDLQQAMLLSNLLPGCWFNISLYSSIALYCDKQRVMFAYPVDIETLVVYSMLDKETIETVLKRLLQGFYTGITYGLTRPENRENIETVKKDIESVVKLILRACPECTVIDQSLLLMLETYANKTIELYPSLVEKAIKHIAVPTGTPVYVKERYGSYILTIYPFSMFLNIKITDATTNQDIVSLVPTIIRDPPMLAVFPVMDEKTPELTPHAKRLLDQWIDILRVAVNAVKNYDGELYDIVRKIGSLWEEILHEAERKLKK